MNRAEEIVENYLKSLGFKDIVFEPDGNIPPDFSIAGRIAVEVRRLNQNFFTEDEVQGLEKIRISLFKLLKTSTSEFDSQYKGNSYWVSIGFGRPIGSGKTVRRAIRKALTDFLIKPFPLPSRLKVTENIYLDIDVRSESVEGRVFIFARGTDRESGGFKLAEFKKNFDHCMKEKSKKIRAHLEKYTSWWLVLVDRIAYGFDEGEKEEIKSMVNVNSCWDKVIVLDSLNGNIILEI